MKYLVQFNTGDIDSDDYCGSGTSFYSQLVTADSCDEAIKKAYQILEEFMNDGDYDFINIYEVTNSFKGGIKSTRAPLYALKRGK